MADTPVDDAEAFGQALVALRRAKEHGDILAFYFALKFHQGGAIPVVGEARPGIKAGDLEDLLDAFYGKQHAAPDADHPVCMVFNSSFKPPNSHSNNNFRDFFQYGNGVGCLADERLLATEFVREERALCQHLTTRPDGEPACSLHPKHTRYIRGLGKPKLMHWDLPSHTYKVADLNHPYLLLSMRHITSALPVLSAACAWHPMRGVGPSMLLTSTRAAWAGPTTFAMASRCARTTTGPSTSTS